MFFSLKIGWFLNQLPVWLTYLEESKGLGEIHIKLGEARSLQSNSSEQS